MSRPLASLVIACMWATRTTTALAQPAVGSVYGVVVADGGVSLPYGVVSVPALGLERFTTVAGSFLWADLPAGPVRFLVRRLGYVPRELEVTVRAGMTDTVRVELTRVAVQLATMQVRAYPECRRPGVAELERDSVLATVFTQLRMNADQFRVLATSYPFAFLVIAYLGHVSTEEVAVVERVDTFRLDGLPKWRYKPGRLVTVDPFNRNSVFFNLPTLIDFADPTFIQSHCFHNGGLVATDSATLLRIDLVAASRIKTPDIDGSIYLDTATYQIRRSVLRLTPLPRVRGLTHMEVATDFEEALPSVPVVAKVSSRKTFDTKVRGVAFPLTFEEHRISDFRFLGARPGEDRKP